MLRGMDPTAASVLRANIPVLRVRGSFFDMGRDHGDAFADAIRTYAAERVELAGGDPWTGRSLSRHEVLSLARACEAEHRSWAPDLMREVDGMAEATGLTSAELIVAGGFTDFIDAVAAHGAEPAKPASPPAAQNCTAFLVPGSRSATGIGLFGQTWDMHASSAEYVFVLEGAPDDAPAFLAFTTVGCVGMVGMNEYGITVGINNLLGADGAVGVTWPFLVRKVLQQPNFDAALECILEAPLAGAHNYLLMDGEGRGANVEASASYREVTPLEGEPLVHTNHCLLPRSLAAERPRDPASQAHSEARLSRGRDLLASGDLGVEDLMAVTRDEEELCYRGVPPKYVETCGAVVADPAKREFWAVKGLPSEHEYVRFSLN